VNERDTYADKLRVAVEALEFYADPGSYTCLLSGRGLKSAAFSDWGPTDNEHYVGHYPGDKARTALDEIKKLSSGQGER